jgi:hypothetical protein
MLTECLASEPCTEGLDCSLDSCVDGDLDFACMVDCFDGDQALATEALLAVLCVLGTCSSVCQ